MPVGPLLTRPSQILSQLQAGLGQVISRKVEKSRNVNLEDQEMLRFRNVKLGEPEMLRSSNVKLGDPEVQSWKMQICKDKRSRNVKLRDLEM